MSGCCSNSDIKTVQFYRLLGSQRAFENNLLKVFNSADRTDSGVKVISTLQGTSEGKGRKIVMH